MVSDNISIFGFEFLSKINSKEVLVAEKHEDSLTYDSGAPEIKQVTTEAFLSGGTSPKNYEGGLMPYRGLVMRANVPEG
jgi:hypothetical protein